MGIEISTFFKLFIVFLLQLFDPKNDLGIYPLQAVLAGFGDQEPERISVRNEA